MSLNIKALFLGLSGIITVTPGCNFDEEPPQSRERQMESYGQYLEGQGCDPDDIERYKRFGTIPYCPDKLEHE